MKLPRRAVPLVFFLTLAASISGAAADKRITPELLWQLGRVAGGSLSPDGQQLAYTVRNYDLAANSGTTDVHVLALKTKKDRVVVKAWKNAGDVQWGTGPHSGRLFFIGQPPAEEQKEDAAAKKAQQGAKDSEEETTEEGEGPKHADKPQVWSIAVASDKAASSQPVQVTDIEQGVGNLKLSPAGSHIAFTIDIKLDPTVNDLFADLPKANARIIDSLMYRHWDSWHDFAYSHLHVAELKDGIAGEPRDLMTGLKADCPLPPFGGAEHYAWSPDGQEIAYTAKIVNNPAESTDSDIYLVSLNGDGAAATCLTPGMNGYDTEPVYSPDGKFLAFHSMQRAGFEADRNRIMLYDRGEGNIRELTAGLDQTVHGARWTPDSQSLVFSSEWRGTDQVFQIALRDGATRQVSGGWHDFAVTDISPDGQFAIVARQDMLRPVEMATLPLAGGADTIVTHVNDKHYQGLALPTIKERFVRASDGKQIHCWVIYPPDFPESRTGLQPVSSSSHASSKGKETDGLQTRPTKEKSKQWPMLTYCQGGPQGQVGQWFSFRWNFHLMAANGYVVLAPNRRGLPGFGQEWNDRISRDYGGQAMQDILAATDSMMAEPYIDSRRMAAVGASFGGYTVYWLMGNHVDRFVCMIAHCGVFNMESKYGSTEELFFPNWDLGGPYWTSDQVQSEYDRFSPHRFVRNWRTPLLVVHGERDFRVPITQGMEAFTAAQVQGVPSRFLYFPEEGHWVQTPQNSVLWQRVFFEWLGRFCK